MRVIVLALLLAGTAAGAQLPANFTKAEPSAKVDTIPAARDVPYPGTITLQVDATDVQRGIFRIHERIPVDKAGDLVLLYPAWLPGHHAPEGQINKIAGFSPTANGKPLTWIRDTLDVYGFHVTVPEGVSAIDVDFQYVSPTDGSQGRIVMTPDLESIQWIANSLYPAGYYTRGISVQANVKVPSGWHVATALVPASGAGTSSVSYQPVSYEILCDSPAIAGAHYRRIQLSDDVALDVIADNEAELAATPEQVALHKKLVEQAVKLFGAQHYDHYDFLFTISDRLGGIGLEHHRSSEDGVDTGYFTKWTDNLNDHNLLPHEYTHSWDGKYRRGKDLWTPDYRTKMEDSLLWVYEGQTQFWGYVLDARSGLLSKQETLDAIASIAANYDNTPGRTWRPLVDTTNDPIIAQRSPQPWRSWQRSEDYYNEGLLIWMDVDRIIRERSGGRKSINDFARAFFGVNDRDYGELTYTFDDVAAALNKVQPYDWADYLSHRIHDRTQHAPLEGITQGGYNLVYTDQPTKWFSSSEKSRKQTDLSYSGGFAVANKDGRIGTVIWDSPAFNAGLAIGNTLVAVNGRAFDGDALKEAIKAAKGSAEPVHLLVKSGDVYRTVDLNWHEGLKYPRLEKNGKGPGTLDALLTPLK